MEPGSFLHLLDFYLGGFGPGLSRLEVLVASSNMLGIREGYVHKVIPRSQCAGGSVGILGAWEELLVFCFLMYT